MKKSFEQFLPFSRPTIDDAAIEEVVKTLRSGWITTGPKTSTFEKMLSEYFEAPYVLAVNSATAGLYISLQALNFEEGDEIITTPMTFVATLNIIVMNKLKPVLVDIDLNSYNIDVTKIEEKITPRTRAIIPVHFAGLAAGIDVIYQIAKKYNLRVIEDAAHAAGAYFKGDKIGSFGDIQVFSFHPNKNMTTGEGGCIVIRDQNLMEKIKLLRFHGLDREAWNRFSKEGSQDYDILLPSHKFNMMDIQAALGIHQLNKLDYFNSRRYSLSNRYIKKLKKIETLKLPMSTPGHSWHLFAPLVKNGLRGCYIRELKSLNIGTGLHYFPVHLFSYYKKTFGWKKGDFPNAEKVGDSIFSLPLFPLLKDEEQDTIINAICYINDNKDFKL